MAVGAPPLQESATRPATPVLSQDEKSRVAPAFAVPRGRGVPNRVAEKASAADDLD